MQQPRNTISSRKGQPATRRPPAGKPASKAASGIVPATQWMARVGNTYSVYRLGGMASPRFSPLALASVAAAHGAAWLALAGAAAEPELPVEPPVLVSVILPAAEPARPAPPVVAPPPRRLQPQPARQAIPSRPQPAPTSPETALATPASLPQAAPAAVEAPQPPAEEPAVAESAPPAVAIAAAAAVTEAAPGPEPLEDPRFDADYLDNPAPAYPRLSRKLGEEGRVLLRVRVSVAGAPAQVELHRSSGHERLDEVAAETVRRWKFAPARQGGKPVAAWVIVPIQFSLKG